MLVAIGTASIKAIQTQNLPAIATGLPIFFLIFSDEAIGKEGDPKRQNASGQRDQDGQYGVHSSSADSPQISHARWAGEPSFLNNWAMWSVKMIGDLGEIKGAALWLTG